jgi:hypothetical protein
MSSEAVFPEPDPLEKDLTSLLNRYSQEQKSGTPDYILAWYLLACLEVWNTATVMRGTWRGESVEQTQDIPALWDLRHGSSKED